MVGMKVSGGLLAGPALLDGWDHWAKEGAHGGEGRSWRLRYCLFNIKLLSLTLQIMFLKEHFRNQRKTLEEKGKCPLISSG